MRRARRARSLQRQLFGWFLAAIVLAVVASAASTWLTRSEPGESPQLVASKHVQHRLGRVWDDPVATEAYVSQLRDTTGLDVRVRRDPSIFVGRGRRARPGGIVFDGSTAYVPVVRRGAVVGALEVHVSGAAPQPWRLGVALLVALFVLAIAARRVSARIARPLEGVARTAERFGAGDLDARTRVDAMSRRWVAEEVREVGHAFDEMAERVGRIVRDQRELLAAVSHELRSPMARSRVALEIARDRLPEGSAAAAPLGDVERHLEEVDAILSDLLTSARVGLTDLRRDRVDMLAWLRDRLEAERASLDVEITLDAQDDLDAHASIDGALLGRAVHNLLANALNHGHPAGQPLNVSLVTTDEHVVVSVTDRGPGFPPELLPRVFEPFVKADASARTPGAGTGLGLTLVARIAEAHGGSALAENVESPVGGRVTLRLPRALSA
ncbi:MAG: ATP-binding protein [Myxococcales bacterium]|nr:ATP-binding protein [Myxococcales bacterium]